MASIDSAQIKRAYVLSRECREGLREAHAVGMLVDELGMNRGSADAYLSAIRHMHEGSAYRRTINKEAVKYFLYAILDDYGETSGRAALRSLDAHIVYYESNQSAKSVSLRLISSDFAFSLRAGEGQVDFDMAVRRALLLPVAERRRRLPQPGHKPREYTATIRVFHRNEYVAAEVLARARGRCEDCGLEAPFLRLTDGAPYLEVHHRDRLADGGDDTVENAIALCPNCHRRRHHGQGPTSRPPPTDPPATF